MTTEQLARKYIDSAERVFLELKARKRALRVEDNKIKEILDYAKDYLEDAKYYSREKKFDVSLTSVAYCEGLLDSLKILGAVNFEWPSTRGKRIKDQK